MFIKNIYKVLKNNFRWCWKKKNSNHLYSKKYHGKGM